MRPRVVHLQVDLVEGVKDASLTELFPEESFFMKTICKRVPFLFRNEAFF
jgi:hypothetical protein